MKQQPFTTVLIKIFANGFYREHAGLLLFILLVMVGAVPPERLWIYEKTLMIAFITSPLMAIVFAVWLLYALRSMHYIAGQLGAVDQQFLFYSSNSMNRLNQFTSWFYLQALVLAPLITYGLIAVIVGIDMHFYWQALVILFYLALLTAMCAGFYVQLLNRLKGGSRQSLLLRLSGKWRKPWFSLYVYHVFDDLKFPYVFTKTLSWLIITGVFYLFADVTGDVRVAGIAMLAVITAHVVLIYRQHHFDNKWLAIARNMPFSKARSFINYTLVYLVLLIPETIWLFARFSPSTAVELLFVGLSITMLFHCLLYRLTLDMEKYLQWILGLFVLIFWIILYKLIWPIVIINTAVSFMIFYRNYYGNGEAKE